MDKLSPGRYRELADLERKLNVNFANKLLLNQALTHPSYAFENSPCKDYQLLEFLGDAFLGFVVTKFLFHRYPRSSEGELSGYKSQLVSARFLSRISRKLGLDNYILLGRGEEASQGRRKLSITAAVFEAIIGAMYLDLGHEKTERFIALQLEKEIDALDKKVSPNYKGMLQERIERLYQEKPLYKVISECGLPHDKVFEVQVSLQGVVLGRGKGKSKKEAEQNAAKVALHDLITSII